MIQKFDPFIGSDKYDTPDVSYVGPIDAFFKKSELQSIDELNKIKDKIINDLTNNNNNFKKNILINKLNLISLYIDYHNYFEKRYGKKTYRFIGKRIDYDLTEESTSMKASKLSNLTDKYSYDGGFVDFWSFSDGIVFKTIKRLKII